MSSAMGKRTMCGSPNSRWMRSPEPAPNGVYRLPSSPSKYDMFSTTATHGTCGSRVGNAVY